MILETNFIHNLDCLTGMKMMEDESVDLIITDPPYDVNYGEKSKFLAELGKSRNKQIERDKHFNDSISIDYYSFSKELFRVLKNNSHCYIFCGSNQIHHWVPSMVDAGFSYKDLCFWLKNKQTFDMSCGYHYNYRTENILFFSKGSKKLNSAGLSNVFPVKCINSLRHPCQKPVILIKKLVENSSDTGDLVFDPFMGSGTTALAARSCHRKYIGFEISIEYCNLIKNRLDQSNLDAWFE